MTDTIEAVALKALIERARNHKMTPQERFDQMVSFVSEGVDKAAVRARLIENAAVPQEIIDAAIATDRRALIKGAGELKRFEPLDMGSDFVMCDHEQGDWVRYDQAAATIAALKAEIERLTERADQAKLDGVRGGIEASAQCSNSRRKNRFSGIEWQIHNDAVDDVTRNIRALDAEAIAKGIITADALSDLLAGDADLIVPDTLADSDGDDGA